ncbi:MAG: hypothetical protein IJ973_03740, partial [Christensenellaceae bacterium]|nr:hypothetical protein [Christensenellaceae bacterium]
KFKLNMEKFHYNPISLEQKELKLFPNIQTYHLYSSEDNFLSGSRICQYVDWRKTSLYLLKKYQKKYKKMKIEFKYKIFTYDDYDIYPVLNNAAIMIGNETRGLSDRISEMADVLYRIPMFGRAESLNAAIAAGIMMQKASEMIFAEKMN